MISPAFAQTLGLWTFISLDRIAYGLSLSTPTKEMGPVYDIPCLCPNTRFVDIFIAGYNSVAYLWSHTLMWLLMMSPAFVQTPGLWTLLSLDRKAYGLCLITHTSVIAHDVPCLCPNTRFVDIVIIGYNSMAYVWSHPLVWLLKMSSATSVPLVCH